MNYFKIGDLVRFQSTQEGYEDEGPDPWKVVERHTTEKLSATLVDYDLFRLEDDGFPTRICCVEHDLLEPYESFEGAE